jgi:hypothetical protein
MHDTGGCEREKGGRTALVCCQSLSLRHLLAPVFSISFLFVQGQGLSKSKLMYSGLLGFWTLSIVWYSKEHNVSET